MQAPVPSPLPLGLPSPTVSNNSNSSGELLSPFMRLSPYLGLTPSHTRLSEKLLSAATLNLCLGEPWGIRHRDSIWCGLLTSQCCQSDWSIDLWMTTWWSNYGQRGAKPLLLEKGPKEHPSSH